MGEEVTGDWKGKSIAVFNFGLRFMTVLLPLEEGWVSGRGRSQVSLRLREMNSLSRIHLSHLVRVMDDAIGPHPRPSSQREKGADL